MSEPAGSTTATASNKRSAGRQQGGGAWKKRQRWQGRGEGRWDRHDRSRPGAEQEAKEERKSDSGEAAGAESGEAGERRLPKRKVALVFGYNGSGFAGLQIQSGSDAPTIEAAVADAILAAGGMLESNRQQLTKLGWQRCARTDKGVSAATNVLSLNLITQPDGILEVRASTGHPLTPRSVASAGNRLTECCVRALCASGCLSLSASTLTCRPLSAASRGCE